MDILRLWLSFALVLAHVAGCGALPVVDAPDASSSDALSQREIEQEPSSIRRPGICIQGGACSELHVPAATSADFLFVIDNSSSMRQEQAALRAQFPRLVRTLTTGEKSNGDVFPPVRDLHLGVVSTDMGIAGVRSTSTGCNDQRHIDGGDDGVLLHHGGGEDCEDDYPAFLSFDESSDDPEKVAQDFSCIADLGTNGCGFEQPLEAALKAIWPKYYTDAAGDRFDPDDNPVTFVSTTMEGRYGHGDVLPERGGNGGFARNDAARGLSLLSIVVVTDEEDCSSKITEHFSSSVASDSPLGSQGINLRCYYNRKNLFRIDRYVSGFQNVRPGHADSVFFTAIVGVPPDLVDARALAKVDFDDPESIDAHYDRILSDSRMQERPLNEDVPSIANLEPSCTRIDRFGEKAEAYPPRRIVGVARGMGKNGRVRSICQDDFGPAIDDIVDLLSANRGSSSCLPRPLQRRAGRVSCDVIVELPPSGLFDVSVPTDCDAPYLENVEAPRKRTNLNGGVNCKYAQVAVIDGRFARGEGFYYDDFSRDACAGDSAAFIAFTDAARPTVDLKLYLDCRPDAQM